jgi:outer membrane protein TolC
MPIRILFGLLLCGAFVASAEVTNFQSHPRPLSLRECIDLALAHNLDLQIEHLSLEVAGYDLSGAYGAYTPVLSFTARHDFIAQPSDFDPKKTGIDFPYEFTTDTFGPSLTGRLPTGLSYDLEAVAGGKGARTDLRSNPSSLALYPGGIRVTNNFYADASLTVRQHLLKDFWIDQDREIILVRRKDLKISQQALRFQIMKTVLAVELAYFDLVAAREMVSVQEQDLQLKQQLVLETRRRVQVGDLPPLDGEQAETQLQNALTALSLAREAFATRQNSLVGILTDDLKDWADFDLQPSDILLAVKETVNRSESFQNALKNRPDLVEARLAVEKSDIAVQFRINQLFPSLDLLGSYGGLGVQADGSTAISDALHFRNPDYFYGAVVSIPLGDIAGRNNYRASKAAKKVSELQLKKAEQGVLLEVANFVNRVGSRFDQVGSTHKARIYAQAALAAEQKKLQNGLSTSFIVLELQSILTSARNAEVQALADYNKVVAQLAFAEGGTMEKNHLGLKVN